MSERNDGGYAFPQDKRKPENYMDQGGYGRCRMITVAQGGMTLRDYFAGQAVVGLLACDEYVAESNMAFKVRNATAEEEAEIQPRLFAKTAYQLADAMLAERERT